MLAMRAFNQKNLVDFAKSLLVVQTINYAASAICNAVAGGDSPASPDSVNNLIEQLKGLLIPGSGREKEDKAKKVQEIMERELTTGPFKVEAMVYEKRGKGLN